jgi:hypothetical protein
MGIMLPMPTTDATLYVNDSIFNSIKHMPDYWQKCLEQRSLLSENCQGSGYKLTPEQIASRLLTAEWKPYSHPSVMPGCMAFETNLFGEMGVVPIDGLPETATLTLQDPKGTGKVEATISGSRMMASYTVIIIGEHEGKNVVFTFHPGAPVRPSTLPSEGNVGKVLTKGQALAMGLQHAKIV